MGDQWDPGVYHNLNYINTSRQYAYCVMSSLNDIVIIQMKTKKQNANEIFFKILTYSIQMQYANLDTSYYLDDNCYLLWY